MSTQEQLEDARREVSHLKRRLAEETQRREKAEARLCDLLAEQVVIRRLFTHGRFPLPELRGPCR